MLCCLPFAWLWLPPNHLRDFSQNLVAVSSFSSNIVFWQKSGYFATAAELNPLLHTWSLAVEEQYYVLFPLFLMLMCKLHKRWIFASLITIAITSLALAQWGSYHAPSAAFFLLPTRGWELAIGALIAFCFLYKRKKTDFIVSNKHANEMLSLLGIALILYSIFSFDKATPFPGFLALIPTIGTGFIIVFTTPQTLVGRLLGTKGMVGVGLVSYSAYLWHQPLFAFARHRAPTELNTSTLLALSGLSIIFAFISWRYVEIPFRNRATFSRKSIFYIALIGSLAFIAVGSNGHLSKGFPERFSIPNNLLETFKMLGRVESCYDRESDHLFENSYCELGDSQHKASFVVFGDSHAAALSYAFHVAASNAEVKGISTSANGCTPLLDIYALRGDQNESNCNLLNKRIYNYVRDNNIEKLFLVARWSYYTDGGYNGRDFSFIGLNDNDEKNKEQSRKAFEYGLKQTIKAYKEIGIELTIVLQVPQQLFGPEEAYKRVMQDGGSRADIDKWSISREKHDNLHSYTSSIFNSYKGINVIDFENIFCNDLRCAMGTISESYYIDDDHLSKFGKDLVIPRIEKMLRKD